jgi:uncharacterized protein
MLIYEKTKNHATQREIPNMCFIEAIITLEGKLTISAKEKEKLTLDVKILENSKNRIDVQIWGDDVSAIDCGDDVANWFKDFLQKQVRLVMTASDHHRPYPKTVDLPNENEGTSFQDGFPFLLTNTSSLQELQSKIQSRILDMRIFRPNIVISGCEAYNEDKWKTLTIGKILYYNVKCCTRCVLPNVDPDTGKVHKEPREALKKHRTSLIKGDECQLFGINLVHASCGKISIHDEIEILDYKDSPIFI